jgi:hypothetical protein
MPYLIVYVAALAALFKCTMDTSYYTYSTKKLRKGSHQAFGETYTRAKSASTVYTIESDDETNIEQYPTGSLSQTQQQFIESFLQGITQASNIDISTNFRAVYSIGSWVSPDKTLLVSCSLLQPNIATGTVHLKGITINTVREHSSVTFPVYDGKGPSISVPNFNPQIQGKYAIPLADSLIQNGLVRRDLVSWSLMVLSQTQPIFVVSSSSGIYECRLTHDSCTILEEVAPSHVGVSHSRSTSQSFSFRNKMHASGGGSGPSITIHRSGTLQYQGKPENAYKVAMCFKECIYAAMESRSVHRFVNSLGIIRNVTAEYSHVK